MSYLLRSIRPAVSCLLIATLYPAAAPAGTLHLASIIAAASGPDAAPQQPGTPVEAGLHIVVLSGDKAVNALKQKVTVKPLLEVRDANEKPVEHVLVRFTAPDNGPGVEFANGAHTATVLTDASGRATPEQATAVRVGQFQYQVVAMYHDRLISANIAQTNVQDGAGLAAQSTPAPTEPNAPAPAPAAAVDTPAPTQPETHKFPRWAIAALIGGAAAGIGAGLALGSHQGSKAAISTSTATVAPGSPAVGAP